MSTPKSCALSAINRMSINLCHSFDEVCSERRCKSRLSRKHVRYPLAGSHIAVSTYDSFTTFYKLLNSTRYVSPFIYCCHKITELELFRSLGCAVNKLLARRCERAPLLFLLDVARRLKLL